MKVSEVYKSFREYSRGERNYGRETLVKQEDCFRAWILPVLGDREVEELTRMDAVMLRNAMRDRGLGAYRQYSVIMALKVFCKFCRLVRKLSCIDPDKEIPLPQRPKPYVEFLTNAEVARVRGALDVQKFVSLR